MPNQCWQRKGKDIAARGDRDILSSIHRIRHRRRDERLPGIEVPKRMSVLGVHRFQGVGVIAKKHEAARGG